VGSHFETYAAECIKERLKTPRLWGNPLDDLQWHGMEKSSYSPVLVIENTIYRWIGCSFQAGRPLLLLDYCWNNFQIREYEDSTTDV